MQKVIITGAAGRMGSTNVRLVVNDNEMELVGAVERKGFKKIDAGIPANVGEIGIEIVDDISILDGIEADVIIDFTMPEATIKNLDFAVKNKINMVIGTTGLTDNDLSKIKEASKNIAIVQSPNMSVGVNVLFKISELVAKILGDEYDVEIVEAHHRFKKDAPSGTAVKLGKIIANALNRDYNKVAKFERHGIIGERTKEEIGMQTLRAGDIVGDHTVLFGGIGERLELTHRAHTRENFARGAIRAAKWLKGKEKGFFTMFDVLGL